MFWRKRKPHHQVHAKVSVTQLATWLGVERRYAVRIRSPHVPVSLIPTVSFADHALKVHDISVGGCCLIDTNEVLGASVGNDVHLILSWPDGSVSVHGRIVTRVDDKRHIQFLNLPVARLAQIKAAVEVGTRAQSLRASLETVEKGPTLAAREIWSSVHGDSVIIEDDIHRIARITFQRREYIFYKQAWPVKESNVPLTPEELGTLIVFLRNVKQPTDLFDALTAHIEAML